ncbi:hypothetical protein H0H87_001111 [Tephrocybe sp. NHM501043]|nr:hypothetical protein H0H87_001111 [Tephrocybe sp. NHM501043]
MCQHGRGSGREEAEQALAVWSQGIVKGGDDALFALPQRLDHRGSWLVLIKQTSLLLLHSISKSPQNPRSLPHLQVLVALLTPAVTSRALSDFGFQVSSVITRYLFAHDLYSLLSHSITSIPLTARASPALPHLVTLATLPLSTLEATLRSEALCALLTHVLTISLLPNRVPAPALTNLSAHIPFEQLASIECARIIDGTTSEAKLNLVANLQVFMPPRYKLLDSVVLGVYFGLVAGLLNALPVNLINPSAKKSKTSTTTNNYDSDGSDSDSPRTRVALVSSFSAPPVHSSPVTPPDARTLKRLSSLPTSTHLSSLLSLPSSPKSRPALLSLLFALSTIWPTDVAPRLLAVAPALVREMYRSYVRGSTIGRDTASGALGAAGSAGEWVPFLLLVELYTKAMMTMGDDEFFGTNSSLGSSSEGRVLGASNSYNLPAGHKSIPRNPLTLDELTEWSRQLLNVAFALYWREEREGLGRLVDERSQEDKAGMRVRCTWEGVRERVTMCLVGIHARDSRKSFVPAGHWLVTSQIDVESFVEAAIFEERELASGSTPSLPALTPSRSRTTYSKRHLSHISPRLGVLNNIPFAIPFDVRVSIFRHFVVNDVMSRQNSDSGWNRGFFNGSGRHRVQVRRGSVAQDGFDRLAEVDMKQPMEIVFIDQFGAEEAGIDGGGVFKEFFTSLCKEVFDTDRGLWLANKKNELYPNPHAYATEPRATEHSLNWYRFIGRILGKAMYEGILVDVAFAGFFLAKWLGKQSFLDDLASLDPDLYNGLVFLKHYAGDLEDLALNFTIAVEELGTTRAVDLIPDGSNVAVTKENRLQYIQLVSHYRLTKQIRLQSEAFFEGLSEMIDPKWIRMFNQQEIQILLGGVNTPIDFDDLRGHTNYGGLYADDEETIVMFWNVVNTFDQEQRMALLRFVTSCSRPPLLGFKELVPNFSIRDASADQHRLPTSSTCVNLLKLPRYKSEKVLRDKLLQAITSNAGFDLS